MEKILNFFAQHFNVEQSRLSWCIIEKTLSKNYHQYLIGLAIANSSVVISVEEACLRRIKRGVKTHPATLKGKRKFRLKSVAPIYKGKFMELTFTEKNLRDLYCDKWYDPRYDIKESTAK